MNQELSSRYSGTGNVKGCRDHSVRQVLFGSCQGEQGMKRRGRARDVMWKREFHSCGEFIGVG